MKHVITAYRHHNLLYLFHYFILLTVERIRSAVVDPYFRVTFSNTYLYSDVVYGIQLLNRVSIFNGLFINSFPPGA